MKTHENSNDRSIEVVALKNNLLPEDIALLEKLYKENPKLTQINKSSFPTQERVDYTIGAEEFDPEDAWIQTYSGKRFTPTNPKYSAIVIQDIAHALSMQCRFSGHCKKFYSVAQHSVLVSYLCNVEDALWGLLHDATEAYLVDIPAPLKRSGKFDAYLDFEKEMQTAICQRFSLPEKEPPSVKIADKIMLATEARDLLVSLREDWTYAVEPAPFRIDPLLPEAAEELFLKRFYQLVGK